MERQSVLFSKQICRDARIPGKAGYQPRSCVEDRLNWRERTSGSPTRRELQQSLSRVDLWKIIFCFRPNRQPYVWHWQLNSLAFVHDVWWPILSLTVSPSNRHCWLFFKAYFIVDTKGAEL